MLGDARFRRFWIAQVISEAGSGIGALGVALLVIGQVLFLGGLQTFSVTQISLRQAITPCHLL